jgi:hypothetical protein
LWTRTRASSSFGRESSDHEVRWVRAAASTVIPAKAGIQASAIDPDWTPAFAGVTLRGKLPTTVIPAKAGIQSSAIDPDWTPRLRGVTIERPARP